MNRIWTWFPFLERHSLPIRKDHYILPQICCCRFWLFYQCIEDVSLSDRMSKETGTDQSRWILKMDLPTQYQTGSILGHPILAPHDWASGAWSEACLCEQNNNINNDNDHNDNTCTWQYFFLYSYLQYTREHINILFYLYFLMYKKCKKTCPIYEYIIIYIYYVEYEFI